MRRCCFFTVRVSRNVFYTWLRPNSVFNSDREDHLSQAAGHPNPVKKKKKKIRLEHCIKKWKSLFGKFVHTDGSLHQTSLFTVCKKVYLDFRLCMYMRVLLNWTIEAIQILWLDSIFPPLVSQPPSRSISDSLQSAGTALSCVCSREKGRQNWKAFEVCIDLSLASSSIWNPI